MKFFSEQITSPSAPTIEQGEEYVELLHDTVRSAGKDVTYSPRHRGRAFLLPGALTEWSEPDTKRHTHIEHDRQYSASVRHLSDIACKLCVLETESWYRAKLNGYYTERNMYRMEWDAARVIEAQVLKQEIISRANNLAVVMPRAYRNDVLFEVTDSGAPDDLVSFRYADIDAMTEGGMFALYQRTQDFQRDLLDARGITYTDAA